MLIYRYFLRDKQLSIKIVKIFEILKQITFYHK